MIDQWSVFHKVAAVLEAAGIAYQFLNEAALMVQGVELPEQREIDVSVQWDNFETAKEGFAPFGAGEVEKHHGWDRFSFVLDGLQVNIICFFNTVVAADHERVKVRHDGVELYAKSWAYYRRRLATDDPLVAKINECLRSAQREHSGVNQQAWDQDTYDAWVARYGTPNQAAERIKKHPSDRLRPLDKYLGDVTGKKVVNLLGSHGSKAVALALLGAEAVVVDISSANAAYANELAEEAGVRIRYVVSDVLELPEEEKTGDADLVLMELGVLHYFIDLLPLMMTIHSLLKPGGRLVLHDFHPISTKLITSKGKKHKVTGNYFETGLEETEVAYSKHLSDEARGAMHKARLRKWTLGEIVTAVGEAGLFVKMLDEEPNTKSDDWGIPKTFTLVATKI